MGEGRGDVLGIKALVEADRDVDPLHDLGRPAREPAAPAGVACGRGGSGALPGHGCRLRYPDMEFEGMKIGRAIIPLLVLCLPGLADVATSASSEPGLPQFSPQTPPRPAPDVTVTTRDGKPVRLADLKGRPVLINLSATWFAPCVSEMPSLDRLADERAGTPLALMAISEDRKGEAAVAPFLDSPDLGKLPSLLVAKCDDANAYV